MIIRFVCEEKWKERLRTMAKMYKGMTKYISVSYKEVKVRFKGNRNTAAK